MKSQNLQNLMLLLEEIAEKEQAAQMELDLEESAKKRELQDKASAEEMRLQAMEKTWREQEAQGSYWGDSYWSEAKESKA